MKTILTSTELTEIYGRFIKPDELAKFLGIESGLLSSLVCVRVELNSHPLNSNSLKIIFENLGTTKKLYLIDISIIEMKI